MRVGLVATLALSSVYGCDEGESPSPDDPVPGSNDAGLEVEDEDEDEDEDFDDFDDEDFDDDVRSADAGRGADAGQPRDAGVLPQPSVTQGNPPPTPAPTATQRTEVPDELVGAWESGAIDFALWESYREGYWAGKSAVPTREAMVFRKNGDAKFYRYEFAFTLYEELIDCEGTVAFHGDGTFTFYPVEGRKRFYDTRNSSRNVDRALTATELNDPELAGKRAYAFVASSTPAAVRITVPSSAPYNWYKKQ